MSEFPAIFDIQFMPDWNPSTGTRGIDSVSTGQVTWTEKNKATCKTHGAMLSVAEDRRMWRCIACGAGCYVPNPVTTKRGEGAPSG